MFNICGGPSLRVGRKHRPLATTKANKTSVESLTLNACIYLKMNHRTVVKVNDPETVFRPEAYVFTQQRLFSKKKKKKRKKKSFDCQVQTW